MLLNKKSILIASILSLTATSALAGGYSRGSADLGSLLGDGSTFKGGITFVSPTRRIDAINGVAVTGAGNIDYAQSYIVPSATASFQYNDARCAGTYAQPYGANAEYGDAQLLAGALTTGIPLSTTTRASLESNELGLTCSYGFDAGPVEAFVIGGAFAQNVVYNETRGFLSPTLTLLDNLATFEASDNGFGYRAGIGIAKKDIALKASLIYRSKVDHTLRGTQNLTAGGAGVLAQLQGLPATTVPALTGTYGITASATVPQSLKLSLQTGVAAGTLVFGSLEWTDWSVLQQIRVVGDGTGTAALAPTFNGTPTPGAPTLDAFFRDGYTANIGIARQFTDNFSALLSYTWDRGTGTGLSDFATTNTFAVGASYDVDETVSIRAGLAYTAIGASTYSDTDIQGNAVTVTNNASQAIGGGLSFNFKF